MQESTSREKVLKRIRNALIENTPNPAPSEINPVRESDDSEEIPELSFAKHLREAGGHFIFCSDMLEFADSFLNLLQDQKWKGVNCYDLRLRDFLQKCEFPLTDNAGIPDHDSVTLAECEFLVSEQGAALISSSSGSGRSKYMYSRALVIVAFSDQLVGTIADSLHGLKEKFGKDLPSSFSFISGPSSTADIGNELVKGAQGPGELYLYMIDKR